MLNMIFSTHGCYTTTTRRKKNTLKKRYEKANELTQLVYDKMNKVIHAVDDNVIHIMVDDHVHKMNHLKKVENIPKFNDNNMRLFLFDIYLTDKTIFMIMSTKCLNICINNNLFTTKTFWNKIIHITFSEKVFLFYFSS